MGDSRRGPQGSTPVDSDPGKKRKLSITSETTADLSLPPQPKKLKPFFENLISQSDFDISRPKGTWRDVPVASKSGGPSGHVKGSPVIRPPNTATRASKGSNDVVYPESSLRSIVSLGVTTASKGNKSAVVLGSASLSASSLDASRVSRDNDSPAVLGKSSLFAPLLLACEIDDHVSALMLFVDNDEVYGKMLENIKRQWEAKKFKKEYELKQKTERVIAALKEHCKRQPKYEANLMGLPENIKCNILTRLLYEKVERDPEAVRSTRAKERKHAIKLGRTRADDIRESAKKRKAKWIKEKKKVKAVVEICPFYHQGYLPDRTVFTFKELQTIDKWGLPNEQLWLKDKPTFDLALLGVNKSLRALFSKIFYSNHRFVFSDARSCCWFFGRIGRDNLRNITKMVFNLSGGFFSSSENRGSSDVCEEQRWCQAFCHLRLGHGLQECLIRFVNFRGLSKRTAYSMTDKHHMTQGRHDLIAFLARFRGIYKVSIINDGCQFLGFSERQALTERMVRLEEDLPLQWDPKNGFTGIERSDYLDKVPTTRKPEGSFPGK